MSILNCDSFKAQFDKKVNTNEISWEAIGFLTPNDRVYPFGTDTKVISTVFEALAAPIIQEIAFENGYIVEGSDQTIYPDFSLSPKPGKPPRIAIDIKTTYRRFNSGSRLQVFRYTLGSYTSFLRSPGATKNIKYPYKEYSDHWVIGFLYTRRPGVSAKVYAREKAISRIACPYMDVEYFIQEKYKIVGLSPASGNTTNIGSFPTSSIDDLRKGIGPFAARGKKVCDEYWRNYGTKASNRSYSNLREFDLWIQSHHES